MVWLATAVFLIVVLVICFQAIYVRLYARQFSNEMPDAGTFDGSVAVVICLRGSDPSLVECLNSVRSQSGIDFQIVCVFDHRDDPAVAAVEEVLGNDPRMTRHFFDTEFQDGSLKCRGLVSAAREIAAQFDVMAVLDADAVVDANWLRDLVAPFHRRHVMATTGNRWFSPAAPASLGSRLRQSWNAAAVVQMNLYQIAWGGSLAVRTRLFKETNLLDQWETAFCEDTMLNDFLVQNDYSPITRVTELVVNNRESTTVRSAFDWITRQLLTARLYHPMWPMVLAHATAVGLAFFGTLVAILLAIVTGQLKIAGVLAVLFLVHQVFNAWLLGWISAVNRRVVTRRYGQDTESGDSLNWTARLLTLLLTQVVQPMAALRAAVMHKVQWRGISYQIRGGRIRMLGYQPFLQQDAARRNSQSID